MWNVDFINTKKIVRKYINIEYTVLDAGLRVPRGILKGNLRDFGLFEQCLGIHEKFDNTYIDGKYCSIRVPVNQNFPSNDVKNIKLDFDPNLLQIDDTTRNKLEERRKYMKNIIATAGDNLVNTELVQHNILYIIYTSKCDLLHNI